MGAGGVPNRTIVKIDGRSGDLPTKGAKPNSRYDLYEYGKKKQSRWFDENGKAIRNRDYFHQNIFENHTFPHDHNWKWINDIPKRNINYENPDYENFN